MRFLVPVLLAFAAIGFPPAGAQDISPAMDPAAVGLSQVMPAAINAQAARAEARRAGRRPVPTASQRAGCARKAEFRARYGADYPKVRTLYRLCRQIGL